MGDVAARDVNKPKYIFITQQRNDDYLVALYRRLANEKLGSLEGQPNDLPGDWLTTNETEVVGLKDKLTRGSLDEHFGYAKECKEKYARHIGKYVMYESARSINAYLLDTIESSYQTSVLPHLKTIPAANKLELMRRGVTEPLRAALGENPLDFLPSHIDGMVFFLTGKCRIKWNG